MRLLLDTHTFLWFVNGDTNLSSTARGLIEDTSNDKYVSVVSAWEMAIKVNTGKLNLSDTPDRFVQAEADKNGFLLLPVALNHTGPIAMLPLHHRDPFDRLLVAQCVTEGLTLVSADAAFDAYAGVTRLW